MTNHHVHQTKTYTKNSYTIIVVLLVVFVGLIIVKNAFQNVPTSAIPSIVTDGITVALGVFIGAFPFVVLGVIFSVITQVFVPDHLIERLATAHPVLRRALLTMAGMGFPVCECGNLPVSRGLMSKGFSPGDATTFLLAAPIINPITIITTAQAFGWTSDVLFGRVIGGIVIANAVGIVFSLIKNQRSLLRQDFADYCEHEIGHHHAKSDRKKESFEKFFNELGMMLPAIILGSVVAALIQTLVPSSVLTAIGDSPILGILLMMLLAFIISICSNVDSFFALSLSNTFSSGSIASFLTFGAMVDVKMVTLMKTTYSMKGMGIIIGIAASGAFAVGLAVNAL